MDAVLAVLAVNELGDEDAVTDGVGVADKDEVFHGVAVGERETEDALEGETEAEAEAEVLGVATFSQSLTTNTWQHFTVVTTQQTSSCT